MKTISLKVPKDLEVELKVRARKEGSSQSALIRNVLSREFRRKRSQKRKKLTLLDLAGDLIGSLGGGPRDLSSNKKYMKNFGR